MSSPGSPSSPNRQKEESAATTIQKAHRGNTERECVDELQKPRRLRQAEAAVKIQKVMRGRQGRARAEELKKQRLSHAALSRHAFSDARSTLMQFHESSLPLTRCQLKVGIATVFAAITRGVKKVTGIDSIITLWCEEVCRTKEISTQEEICAIARQEGLDAEDISCTLSMLSSSLPKEDYESVRDAFANLLASFRGTKQCLETATGQLQSHLDGYINPQHDIRENLRESQKCVHNFGWMAQALQVSVQTSGRGDAKPDKSQASKWGIDRPLDDMIGSAQELERRTLDAQARLQKLQEQAKLEGSFAPSHNINKPILGMMGSLELVTDNLNAKCREAGLPELDFEPSASFRPECLDSEQSTNIYRSRQCGVDSDNAADLAFMTASGQATLNTDAKPSSNSKQQDQPYRDKHGQDTRGDGVSDQQASPREVESLFNDSRNNRQHARGNATSDECVGKTLTDSGKGGHDTQGDAVSDQQSDLQGGGKVPKDWRKVENQTLETVPHANFSWSYLYDDLSDTGWPAWPASMPTPKRQPRRSEVNFLCGKTLKLPHYVISCQEAGSRSRDRVGIFLESSSRRRNGEIPLALPLVDAGILPQAVGRCPPIEPAAATARFLPLLPPQSQSRRPERSPQKRRH